MDFEGEIRSKVEKEIARLQKILAMLDELTEREKTEHSTGSRRGRRKGSKLSAAARARISAAQKARWAKVKSQKKG